ncbi:hypothetical protein V490_01347 [Pseudogymnoascus sp. VKM F-3557]|nr:hypothetical protein V490_01347 [Pseudogymnoascus sp. VKM F-3557]
MTKMSFPHYYDGGSAEILSSSAPKSVVSDCQDNSEDSEYVYVKYRIANKRLSSMENEVNKMKATIDSYAMTIRNEMQFRELCQLALLDEQTRYSECHAAYLRLLQFWPRSSDEEKTAYKSQTEHLLTVIEKLQMIIQNMREQYPGALCLGTNHTAHME